MRIGRMFMVVSGLSMSAVLLAGPAGAEECGNAGHAGVVVCPTDPGDPGVSGTQVRAPADPADPEAQVLGLSISRGSSGVAGLPITGSDVVPLLVIGGAALGAGAVLTVSSKRRRSEA